mmetsp:Transcript_32250/g.32600  ORF Transcript_32250/g.32600 Transcript_32250/m.32600 type:complete len:153 (-) Transcript_32250:612-1070(-)
MYCTVLYCNTMRDTVHKIQSFDRGERGFDDWGMKNKEHEKRGERERKRIVSEQIQHSNSISTLRNSLIETHMIRHIQYGLFIWTVRMLNSNSNTLFRFFGIVNGMNSTWGDLIRTVQLLIHTYCMSSSLSASTSLSALFLPSFINERAEKQE